ncbi:alpha/beta hydrolase [Hyphococcus sp.]|uniref:alpha/beta hydrolase n=1 Tax=Hyphococcus sp. TaxID=2038636 RepID=UPI00208CD800|nr:MAG: hypothetical protein DHS20C04_09770 [Marinicaulis sp.]
MNRFVLMIAVIAVQFCATTVLADTYNSSDRTSEKTLRSDSLDEKRTIIVRTPPKFDPKKTYPVVYVLDGEWNFEYVASYLDYMMDNEVYPDVIVTGVKNVNRNRDYTPAADPYFDDTGGADNFLSFVEGGWIAYIDGKYPVSDERILVGHSFGGVFTLHALFSGRDLFSAYMAFGSSVWLGDNALIKEADAYFARDDVKPAFVYMAAGEGDGGPTTSSGEALAARFEAQAPVSLEWAFAVTPKTDHFKNFATGMHDAFMALFPAWGFDAELGARARVQGAKGVDAWFAEKQAQLGYRFKPAWFDLSIVALGLTPDGHGESARAIMAQLSDAYPMSPHVAAFAASVFEQNKMHEAAAASYERAIAIAKEEGLHPNVIHLGRLERGAARNRAAE